MSADKEKVAEVGAQTTAKRMRRGVNNQTKAVAQLRFHEKDSAQNGLFIGHLDSVTVDWSVNAEGKAFTGEKVPRVTLHFASNHDKANETRHVYYTINCVESNVNTIPDGSEAWRVDNIFNWMKHILDVYYLKGRELTEDEEAALSLPFVDYDDNGVYVPVETEEVINGYAYIFNNFAAMMNGQFGLEDGQVGKPVYKTADGKFIPAWLKLLRHKKVKGEWKNVGQNGELGFDSFLGNGVVELVVKGQNPSVLRVDLAKESITPKETKKAPSIGTIGGGMAGGVMAGSPMDMGAQMNNAFADASSDMPF